MIWYSYLFMLSFSAVSMVIPKPVSPQKRPTLTLNDQLWMDCWKNICWKIVFGFCNKRIKIDLKNCVKRTTEKTTE